VYQGVLGNVDRKLLNALERVTIGALKPDLTFILDAPAELGLTRAKERRGEGEADRFEGEGIEAHAAMRKAFLRIAAEEPQRCVAIDASSNKDAVAEQIWTAVVARLAPGGAAALVEAGPSAANATDGEDTVTGGPVIRRLRDPAV
jgi:dTMP kinase